VKSILLPTDFSKNSINAINYAMALFKNESCEFYVINIQKASSFVSDDLMTMSSSATIYNTLIDVAKKSIKNIISNAEENFCNNRHRFYSVVDYDNFVDGINQICEEKSINLIVMGTKGASGIKKMIFGSNTVHLMKRCNVPVLAIPDGCNFSGLNSVAFTSNYKTIHSNRELSPLVDILKLYNSKLEVLHLSDENYLSRNHENNRTILDSCFSNINHEFVDLEGNSVFKTIKSYIGENDIKMLAMMSEKYSFLEHLFTSHLEENFAFKIDIPFLVMENTIEA